MTTAPAASGIHHIKFPVSDLERAIAFYTRVFSAEHVREFDHLDASGQRYAVILRMPSWGSAMLELRLDRARAAAQEQHDPVTWAVADRASLAAWREWLEQNHVPVSKVFTAVKGWVLVAQDPDKRFLRWYSLESHDWEGNPDHDAFWLGN